MSVAGMYRAREYRVGSGSKNAESGRVGSETSSKPDQGFSMENYDNKRKLNENSKKRPKL
uniref:Uncharacterized protein n=1 Tax=Romanomermis culicivorax TaxID=13658 RepID=A0A915KXF9_ROMCU